MNVTIEIDELVLRGMPPGRVGYEVVEALERELARLVALRGLPQGVTEQSYHTLPALTIRGPAGSTELGAMLAEVLYSSLHTRLAGAVRRNDGMRSP